MLEIHEQHQLSIEARNFFWMKKRSQLNSFDVKNNFHFTHFLSTSFQPFTPFTPTIWRYVLCIWGSVFHWEWKLIENFLDFVSLWSVIGQENLRHSLNQSNSKLGPIASWSFAFYRTSGSLLVSLWALIGSLWFSYLIWLAAFRLPLSWFYDTQSKALYREGYHDTSSYDSKDLSRNISSLGFIYFLESWFGEFDEIWRWQP